ncbi:unnamed protein product [Fraxinus pennsylvanica]|uniref:GTP cyclohydrolase 1 n=1 Tax=Fraxinus pennsylvanica TaxID=56036 RepID=A0AAD1ZRF3_9LAMI|nr:unnamed protein product [Fraxinus pennsylvanica]
MIYVVCDIQGYKQKVKDIVSGALFPEAGLESGVGHAGGVGGLVIVRDLDLFSYCESYLFPFQIKCHVGYVPSGQRVVGLSKVSRVADTIAKRLQDPQRLAYELCTALQHGFRATGVVAVVLQCSHIHLPNFESAILDPNHEGWVKILVASGSGVFKDEKSDSWTDFFSLLRFRDINVEDIHCRGSIGKSWCPAHSFPKTEPANPVMLNAVASILCSLGEDPLREELIETPDRFVKWLMKFRNTNPDMKLNGFVRNRRDSLISNGVDHIEDSICSELNLTLWSQCEHHLLPFHGVVHIGFYCSNGVYPVGRSLLQSIVHFYGFKLQVQERLTRQIAETVSSILGEDVMVAVEANHTCMIARGIEKFGSNTATIGVLGRFSTDPAARAKFLQIIPSSCPA